MNWPLTIAIITAWAVLPPLFTVAILSRLPRNAADDAGEQHPEPLFIGGGEFLAHAQPTTDRSRNDHA